MAKRPHILFLPRWYPNPEDPQLGVFIQKHAKAAAMHHQVTVIYPFGIDNANTLYDVVVKKEDNLTEVSVWYKKSNSTLVNTWRYYYSFLKAKRAIKLQWRTVDIAHVNIMAKSAVMALLLKLCCGIPYLITEQWSGYTNKSGKFAAKATWQKAIWRFLSRQAEFVITVSRFLGEAMKQQRMHSIFKWMPNVVESITIKELVKPQNGVIKLLNVSDLVDDTKNITGLLNALQIVVKTMPNVHLDIVGGGKDEALMKQHCCSLKLDKFVSFHGRVTNDVVYEFMHQTQAVVINSYFETFSVVAAEGLICGKPVIATDCGGPSEFINDEVGKLVPIANDQQLAEGIIAVLQELDTYKAVELNKYAQQKFSYDAVSKQLQGFYADVLAK